VQGREYDGAVPVPAGRDCPDRCHVAGFDPKVQLLHQCRRESSGQFDQSDATSPPGSRLHGARKSTYDVEVAFDDRPDAGSLDLHRHLSAAVQPCLVHLGDRRGSHRLRIKFLENF